MATISYPARPLPRWLILVGSLVVAFHLVAITARVLTARSGPWVPLGPFPITEQEPPPFAVSINDITGRFYLEPLHLAHNYHFASNHTDRSVVRFDAKLMQGNDTEIRTLQFPDENVNFWVRERQRLLAQNLGGDEPMDKGTQNVLPAPGQAIEMVHIWEMNKGEGGGYHLKSRPVTEFSRIPTNPNEPPKRGPGMWSRLVAKSFSRHLEKQYSADSVELIRRSRDPVPPVLLFMPRERWPQEFFTEMVADFTER